MVHLDLEEQEQLDQLKHFWAKYGNLITWVLIVVAGAMAAWNGWQYWQRTQAAKAAALYDEIERAAQGQDTSRLEDALSRMQDGYGSTVQACQAALLAARALYEAGKTEAARAALGWVARDGADAAYRALARLRLSALELEDGRPDAALSALEGEVPPSFVGLFDDRRGDILLVQGKDEEARRHFEVAWRALSADNPYRQLVEVKLASLGVPPASLAARKES
jgi:predicted negative regulator of RcsB-dependent stress response